MGQEEQAAPPVLKAGILPLQPGPVAVSGCVSRFFVLVLMMTERIPDHGDRDLSIPATALGSDEPVHEFYADNPAACAGSLER